MNIAAYIRSVRIRAGLSQTAFGKELKISRSRIANYETGRSRPSADFFLTVQAFEQSLNSTQKTKTHSTFLYKLKNLFS